MFCAVKSIIDQIKNEQQVDIFRVVKRLKMTRYEMINTQVGDKFRECNLFSVCRCILYQSLVVITWVWDQMIEYTASVSQTIIARSHYRLGCAQPESGKVHSESNIREVFHLGVHFLSDPHPTTPPLQIILIDCNPAFIHVFHQLQAQYNFCYESASAYLQSFDTYGNLEL